MISRIPQGERPRERCLRAGAHVLSLRECLALLIGSGPKGKGCLGVAEQLLQRPGKGLSEEEEARAFFNALESPGDALFVQTKGLGAANKARLLAAFEIARRYAQSRFGKRSSPKRRHHETLEKRALKKIRDEMRFHQKEWLGFVPVYSQNQIGAFCLVEMGVRTHVNTDALEFFARLLPLRPLGFYLFHNHPSGDLTPSKADLELTKSLSELARPFGVQFLGHAVVARSGECWIA